MDAMRETVPGLRKLALLPGRGHWTQQERPAEVNADLVALLAALDHP
jgi:pimeloyl-ACP methyl ester carboxylesterase